MERATNQQSLQMNQLHPYEYLTQLNSIYTSCNKANAKSFSSVSKIKLAWKPFSIMKIPPCFEQTYTNGHQSVKQSKLQHRQVLQETEKKIWKDHQQILKRYNNCRKQKLRVSRPQTSIRRNTALGKENKEQNAAYLDQSKNLLKKMQQKGVKIQYDRQELKNQVLKKLKQIQIQQLKKPFWRAQSAVNSCNKRTIDVKINEQNYQPQGQLYWNNKPYITKQRKNVQQNEYLLFDKSEDIISNYKHKIKQVDCAISEYNIKKTANILRNMENIIQNIQ